MEKQTGHMPSLLRDLLAWTKYTEMILGVRIWFEQPINSRVDQLLSISKVDLRNMVTLLESTLRFKSRFRFEMWTKT